jgi:hypothetical protein
MTSPDLNPLNTELNPICHLLTLLGAHHILHFSGIRINFFHFLNGLPSEFAVAAFDLVVMAEKKTRGSIPVDLYCILLLTVAERSFINAIFSPT